MMRYAVSRSARHALGLMLPMIVLSLMGILSIQAIYSSAPLHDLSLAAVKQAGFLVVGILVALVTIAVGYHRLGRVSFILFGVSLFVLFLLQMDRLIDMPFIPVRNGSRRWIEIASIQFQPSEIMKIVYVLTLAWYLRYRRDYRTFSGLLPPFLLTLMPMGLILVQPDLGTVLLFVPVLFAMLYTAGAKLRHLLLIMLIGVMCLPLFWVSIAKYQRLRIVGVFLQNESLRDYFIDHPESWELLRPAETSPQDWQKDLTQWEKVSGYQIVRSKAAIGSGQVMGNGWGKGIFIEYNFLPERENDFIFAMIAHQWGLLGGLMVILCYVAIVLVGYDVATLTDDPFGRLISVGIATLIGVQALTNLIMTVGLAPVTGVTLPFVSKGGSSLVASVISLALLISVAQQRPVIIGKRPFQFDEEEERYQAVVR